MVGKRPNMISGLSVEHLLTAISQFLNSDGGIKSENDCVRFNNCMIKLGYSMHSICTFLNVINATEDEAVLSNLMSCGGWETLHRWLSEFKEVNESPVLVLLLETFQRLPVSMEMLKANTTAKIIKGLRKHTDDELKTRAGETVDKWMQLIKAKTSSAGVSSNQPSSASKNGEHKEKEKKKKRHKHSSGEKPDVKNVANSPPKESMDVDRDVPSPPPPAIFKDSSKSTSSDKADKSTTKQHSVKERSAGVEAGLIKPKPRGSKPSKASTASPKPPAAIAGALSSHKRCVWSSLGHTILSVVSFLSLPVL